LLKKDFLALSLCGVYLISLAALIHLLFVLHSILLLLLLVSAAVLEEHRG